MSSHLPQKDSQTRGNNNKATINIALAGNPNVGKSVIFNQLTGLSQTIGNWPGKTVEKKEGHLNFSGYHFNIVDLPGIYSLSTYSIEEIVSREYIVSKDVDIIINVIDSTNLERNLFFTFQLLELQIPMIIAMNQMDILRKRNIDLDFNLLQDLFQLPVLPVVAVHGTGVHHLLNKAIEMVHPSETNSLTNKNRLRSSDLSQITTFGKEVENKVVLLLQSIKNSLTKGGNKIHYPPRFLAIKLLENDEEILKLLNNSSEFEEAIEFANEYRKQLEEYHGEDIHTILSSEIYKNITTIIKKVVKIRSQKELKKASIADKLDHLTTHSFFGYVILVLVLVGIYLFTFTIGDLLGGLIENFYNNWTEMIYSVFGEDYFLINLFWDGALGGFFGGLAGVLVYVIPFFFVIEVLQDSGYLPRAAFLMDRMMHAIGVHGKTIITMILGLGCNVPACMGCRIMETEREKKISIALTSLVPCAAVMTVVMGLVGRYLGLGWVVILFAINFSVILLVGRILNKIMPGKCTELIMEMHEYRVPNFNVIFKQTWMRTKGFIFKALPIIIGLGILLELLFIFNILEPINVILSPITVFWLGLPAVTGIFLIYGILRKELTLVLLSLFSANIGLTIVELFTPIQMIVFSLVTMLYVPCFATIVIIAKNSSWKYALQITFLEISLALLIGGIVHFGFLIFSSV
ncbi:MAG: ferrous iron transport protein B [Candidatus Lokiarchaeota archaeon]|nr:ferrous iron transport protein B [Candidatus Lokiarchaeota archaeon]